MKNIRTHFLFLTLLVVTLLLDKAEAKIFNVANERTGAYLRGGYHAATFSNTLVTESRGANSEVDASLPYNTSGEFGFIYGNPIFHLKFGLELMRSPDIKNAIGSSPAGAELYSLTSEMSVVIPKVGLDINLKKWPKYRVYAGGSAGFATLTARNSYTFTSAGTTEYGLSDFYEDLRSTSQQYEGWLGVEGLLSDSTTWAFEGVYKALVFDSIDHNRDATTFQGSVTKGDHARNRDGSARSLDLTQIFVTFTLRFWVF